ncbi:NAD-dependent epimerase/dehydratase family protein [Thermogemmatispora tikiterensis]|uniref:UDP-glucose 4-epimerase n=1 Tax=Thermogemmatispora tikiterensis TaxID=1825093 RepID=A0A328VJQ2_9CHLR|nr:NAD(P)-dependent oxidoreductase [Thermogemmatispora tikiterensis]RAQ98128.1 NAD-dependent dehydratase [Thermogemmatispora tikiterensis]
MRVLVTGAFGNIGFSTVQELLRQGHTVRCLDLRTKPNEQKASQISREAGERVTVQWGDIRQREVLAEAVRDQEVVVHLAAILPPDIYEKLELAYEVNVEGTRNAIEVARQQPRPPRFLFGSSLDVFGYTQDQPPPRKVTDPVQATDDYTRHKLEGEAMLKQSGLTWTIFRFADVPPLGPRPIHPIMFRIPLETRLEMLHTFDAGLAVANAVSSDEVWGKIWLIGGGPSCQVRYRDYLNRMLEVMGIGSLPEEAFGHEPYCTDWLDTSESQRVLRYQRHSFEEIIQDVAKYAAPPAPVRALMPLLRPVVRRQMLKLSPYWQKAQARSA